MGFIADWQARLFSQSTMIVLSTFSRNMKSYAVEGTVRCVVMIAVCVLSMEIPPVQETINLSAIY